MYLTMLLSIYNTDTEKASVWNEFCDVQWF